MGELDSTTIAVGRGNDIQIVRRIRALNSLGILYGVFILHLGFYMAFDEYKVIGNRSILADPRDPGMRDRINHLVKKREAFRPFAPAVTAEAAHRYFEIAPEDVPLFAHMLFVARVRASERPRFPAVTHVDGSARVQTVAREESPRFWQLLDAFETLSGAPMLLNTSFNVRGQPIVCTPEDAIDTFLRAQLDALVIGDYLVVGSS
jgi:carbamoyltransferase